MSKGKTEGKAVLPKRDNFTQEASRRLRDSAGNVCSFPGCHVHTHGASATGDGVVNLGVACHIKAAAPGGPRFDVRQTSHERKHIDNAIWMCQTHSRLIDADESNYSVDDLLAWKREAEVRANAQLNQRSFTEKDVRVAVDQGSAALLQRFVNISGDPVNAPVQQILEGYEASLERLDPRFSVVLNKNGNSYTHVIQPVADPVDLSLVVEGTDKIEGYLAAEKAFIEEGRELVIPTDHFRLEGSKLIEALHEKARGGQTGTLTLSSPKRELPATLYVRTPEGRESIIDSFTCYYTSGSLRTVFEGKALDGLFTIRAVSAHDGKSTQFDVSFKLDAWLGKNVLEFPRFPRLMKAAELLETGRIVVELEIEGEPTAFDSRSSKDGDEFHLQAQWLIRYLELARTVARKCSTPIVLFNTERSPEVYALLAKYAKLLAGDVISTQKPGMLCKGEFDYAECFTLAALEEQGIFEVARIADNACARFEMFGQVIEAPRILRLYTKVDYMFYSDLEKRGKPKFEIHSTADTALTTLLHPDDSWSVLKLSDVAPDRLDHKD